MTLCFFSWLRRWWPEMVAVSSCIGWTCLIWLTRRLHSTWHRGGSGNVRSPRPPCRKQQSKDLSPGAQRGTSVPEGFPGARRIWPALAQPETVPGARHRPLAHGMQGRRPGQVIGVLGSRGTGLSPSGPREGAAGPRAGGIVRAVSEVLGFRGGRGRPCR
ncbi:uncharacterized protein LOC119870470 isoform X9 [Canis lupus familiaris]|uniref:uncharacterized protein LOC119870470 isoform X9 n=1 Tax=Canis lupus familiaris TaxID=9615 RepID=UPI0018F6CF7F|nr:uncharacterized protein LOC119870470 isoform X9 [Canis lupus familiaris]